MLLRLWRSTFGVVALVAMAFTIATLAIGVVAYDVTHEALEQQLDHRIAVETRALLDEAQQGGLSGIADAIRLREATRTTSSLDYLLADAAGRPMAATIVSLSPIARGYEEFFRFRRGHYVGVGQSLTVPVAGGMLVVLADRRDLDEIDRTLERLLIGALGAMLSLGVGSATMIGWLTRRRLSRIDGTAKAIIAGDMTRRMPRDASNSEFDRLAATLNQMLDRITALMDNLKQVSTDVAHDLRTPLTRLCNQLDRAVSSASEADRTAAIHAAQRQAGELLEIFAALLRIAEVEGLAERRALAQIDLSSLLEEMVDTYRPDYEASGHHLISKVSEGLQVRADRRLIAQAVSNLLENVLRHTPAGTVAILSGSSTAGMIRIALDDDGPGVPADDAPRLFQRFARTEASRTTPGHGLGLALARAVAIGHGGTAEIARSRAGLTVTIDLPRSR